MPDINKARAEQTPTGTYHSPSTQSKEIKPTLSPAQRKLDAEIIRGYVILALGVLCFISVAIFVMAAGDIPTKERLDTLLKFILPVAASMIGYSAGGRK